MVQAGLIKRSCLYSLFWFSDERRVLLDIIVGYVIVSGQMRLFRAEAANNISAKDAP